MTNPAKNEQNIWVDTSQKKIHKYMKIFFISLVIVAVYGVGSHRVRHNWSDFGAAAAAVIREM